MVDIPGKTIILNHMVESKTPRLRRIFGFSCASQRPWIPCDDASFEDFWNDRLDVLERLLREEDAEKSPTCEGDEP